MENIITALPKTTASANCCILIFDNPATTLMTADGENGKQSSKNSSPNPCRSSQEVTFLTCLFCWIFLNNRLFPSLRIIKNTRKAPAEAPAQDNRNPSSKPYAAAFAITKTTNGRNGRNASINGSKNPGNGPSAS